MPGGATGVSKLKGENQLTKSEKRKARKAARAADQQFTSELALEPAQEFSETPRGYCARERWARSYDELNGAPEGDWDR